jgi:hypothetical protein
MSSPTEDCGWDTFGVNAVFDDVAVDKEGVRDFFA